MDSYYSFAFKGLLTEEALDKAGRNNKIVNNSNLDVEIVKRLPFEILDDELIAKSRRMATVYTALTSFENMVRQFVSSKLIEEFKDDWWVKGVTDKIRKKAESRKDEEEKIRWHTQRGMNLINYIEFGDLISIIINNWSLFEPHTQTQDWVNSILKPLERSRNVLMHSGELELQDIERIGTLIRDWIAQVGN
ncbi:MAG: Swt1 family HEPN domain-containing protein [Candidatus Pacearchaeota archaeon]|nr:Swt1 family HEPN domain-containing protein [Candidatus Pacearchaeota archaeon]